MRDDLKVDIVARLKADYGFKERKSYLQQGRCPSCGKHELFCNANEPWSIRCGRQNKCAYSANVRDLYPDAFGKINERFPATTEEPNATADAFLSFVRGVTITGRRHWYRQGAFRHPKGNRTTATVVFDITGPGVEAGTVWMERLVEPVTITGDDGEPTVRKANFVGAHKGLWWQPPDLEILNGEELWLVEACIDAMSLADHGVKAVATLSCVNYPEKMLAALAEQGVFPVLVWALDNDPAGRRYISQHVETARAAGFTCKAALIPQLGGRKTDWNDAHVAKRLTAEDLDRYRHHGDLFLAPSALEKGLLIWKRKRSISFSLEYDTRVWWWDLPQATYSAELQLVAEDKNFVGATEEEIRTEAARRSANVQEIANVSFQFLYFQKSELTDESWYYVRIRFPHGRYEIKNTFTGAQVATASEFKKRLLSIAPGALFTGATWQLNWLVKHHLDNIKIVDTVDFIGYSKEHEAWIFNNLAVSNGRVFDINDEDFFEVASHSVKSLSQSLHLHIGAAREYRPDWLELVYQSFGPKGIVAAAFFLGSLFAEQIRQIHKSYPFLEIVGEAGAGKSTLIEFLWKLLGRADYEGFDPNKSTLAARARIMSQVSNMPISLIESDRGGDDAANPIKQRQFDWDELKTAYNGRASRARGVANGGNDTLEPPFRGSILISQNAPVNASEAIMQRIIHLAFDTAHHSATSKRAADTLAGLPVETVSHFLIQATCAEARIMKAVEERSPIHEAELLQRQTIKSVRIAKNHGQLMALVEALADLTRMPHDWRDQTLAILSDGAEQRQGAIASDHPIVEEFWELVEFLGFDYLNHAGAESGLIAVNLNEVLQLAGRNNQPVPPVIDWKRHLKGSRSRIFVDVKSVRSRIKEGSVPVKCWVFKDMPKNGGR